METPLSVKLCTEHGDTESDSLCAALKLSFTWVQSLGWEDLEEGMATHSSILAWRIPIDRGAWWATGYRVGHEEVA